MYLFRRLLVCASITLGGLLLVAVLIVPTTRAQKFTHPSHPASLAQTFLTYLPFVVAPAPEPMRISESDDFSLMSSGWFTGTSSSGTWDYVDEEYEVEVVNLDWWKGSAAPYSFTALQYTIEADMRQVEGNTGFYGLVFNRSSWDEFHVFLVNPGSERFSIRRRLNSQWEDYIFNWTVSPFINPDFQSNHLKLERSDPNNYRAYVNGELVAEFTIDNEDGVIISGRQTGLIGSASVVAPATKRFDNFRLEYLNEGARIGPMADGRLSGSGRD